MTATSSARLGRKINRPSGALRTPACASCAQRRVRCDGGSPCQACLRLAAWTGHPPPLECTYADGYVPARKNGPLPPALAAYGNAEASTSTAVLPPPPPKKDRPPNSSTSGKKCRRSGGPALQKGLACLACKSRRIRCDGAKPACGACARRQKRSGDAGGQSTCVYRADLYLMAQDHATEGEVGGVAEPRSVDAPVKVEEERDIQVDPNASEGARDMIFQDFKPVAVVEPNSPSSLLSTVLPALPPLPSTSVTPGTSAMASTTSTSSSDVFPPYPLHSDNAPPYPLRPTADASSYFSTLPERSSSFSSSSTVTPSDLDLDELLSSCSSWPSPRTPLDPYALLCLKDNYPPVPYPPPAPAPSSLGLGGAGIDPRWMDACALNVPPLELSALALYSWPDEGVAPPLCTGADVGAGVGVGVAAGSEPAVKAHEVGDVMLTLPLEPAFAGEWTATGAVRGRGPM